MELAYQYGFENGPERRLYEETYPPVGGDVSEIFNMRYAACAAEYNFLA